MIRNMQIRSKLIAVLVIPLVGLTVMAAIGIAASVSRGVQADRVNDQAVFAVSLSKLVHELQGERDLSAGWVGSGRDAGYGPVVSQRVLVNQALQTFRNDAENLDPDTEGSAFRRRVDAALKRFDQINEERKRIEADPGWTVARTLDFYSNNIAGLFAVELELAGETDDRNLIRNVATFVSLGRYKEAASQERGVVYAVASTGRFAPGEFQRFATTLGAQDTWRSQFEINASPEQAARLDALQSHPDVTQTNELRNFLRNALLTGNATSKVDLDPREWFQRTSARIDLLRGVEATIADDVAAASQAAQSAASRQALLYSVTLAVVLVLTVALSLWLARSMVGPLRTLTRSANEVADERLPGLVDKLQHARDPRDLDIVPEPVPVNSKDEIGQVSAAFNSVHRVAIQVATEQAALRKSIGDMFLNLARRSQSLIDRQLELIDDLEHTEADPDALDNLFKLDHLATRMRRNSEDLIVLSGAEPARRWSQPVPLVDVVRAALAEVEDYNRVELLPIDDIGVAGQAVSDVVHLLAELIENATSFSPPGTKVQVAGQQVSNGYVIEIEDRGLGMSDEELVEANERLANPPVVDFALSRMLGLYVVARLAERYSIKVQLRHSWYRGITALVLLPPSLTVRVPVSESLEAVHNGQQRPQLAPPARPSPDGSSSAGQVAAPAAAPPYPAEDMGDGQPGVHLPIFEAARSDWFDEEDVHRDHLPLRRHGAERPHAAPAPEETAWADGVGPEPPPASAAIPLQHPPPASAAAPLQQPPPTSPAPPAGARHLRQEQPSWPPPPTAARHLLADQPSTLASSPPPASATPLTPAGLPRRVPRANLAPGMLAEQEPPPVTPDPPDPDLARGARGRSPEEVRSMLSSYRSGVERGRTQAGPESAADPSRSSRSDDDPTQ
jgi:signal transduction histidine kinase